MDWLAQERVPLLELQTHWIHREQRFLLEVEQEQEQERQLAELEVLRPVVDWEAAKSPHRRHRHRRRRRLLQ